MGDNIVNWWRSGLLGVSAFMATFVFASSIYACGDKGAFVDLHERYKNLQSYRDTGIVEIEYFKNGILESTEKKTFKTYYVSPDKFRFEWTETTPLKGEGLNIIVSNQGDVVSYMSQVGYKSPPDIKTAVSQSAGLSNGVSYMIPSMLIDLIPVQDINSLEEFSVKTENMPSGESVAILSLVYKSGTIEDIYVGSSDRVIKKVERTKSSGNKTIKERIVYSEIILDSDISDEIFGIKQAEFLGSE